MSDRRDEQTWLAEEAPGVPDPFAAGADHAMLVLTFLRALETGGLSHAEALWLTAQVWRAS